jgi:hypothetical protein
MQPLRKACRYVDAGHVSYNKQRASDHRIVTRAGVALQDVTLHPHEVDSRQKVINEGDVISAKLAAVHWRVEGCGGRSKADRAYPFASVKFLILCVAPHMKKTKGMRKTNGESAPGLLPARFTPHPACGVTPTAHRPPPTACSSVERRSNNLRERVASAVQARLYRSKITRRDLGDFLV